MRKRIEESTQIYPEVLNCSASHEHEPHFHFITSRAWLSEQLESALRVRAPVRVFQGIDNLQLEVAGVAAALAYRLQDEIRH